ncbi:MAG: DsrE family protein [Pseudomonadota bacterium]|nr:DsrE family protein [Pseudomonadota bacterium]
MHGALTFASTSIDEEEYPEAQEIETILTADSPPAGVLFSVLEYNEDALEWIVPRIEHYVSLLRERYPDLAIVIVSHGDEMLALREEEKWLYRDVHQRIQRLAEELGITFHVCGAYAMANGIDESEFPQYVDVVPLATTQIQDYRELGYTVITTELSW